MRLAVWPRKDNQSSGLKLYTRQDQPNLFFFLLKCTIIFWSGFSNWYEHVLQDKPPIANKLMKLREHENIYNINNNNNLLHLYSAFLGTQSALHCEGDISSSTTNVQHPHGWFDGSHIAPERPPHHTPAYWWRGDSDAANQCMGMIRRPWWSESNGKFGQDAGVTPLLFFSYILGFLMTTESQDLGLTSHPKDVNILHMHVCVLIVYIYN